ncbi:hypothetical protein [Herbiconiux sp. VKM Ac-2851]|uniref:hypothetical protein n=1 Tax=Herbiconiux sp. VKM Ac-2851 TaxID=2739025 RepID=UPI001566B2CA|nr:hypothetical protein [Herbiconiux sp. VKM Ac-2851]NQX35055.1 hypothetical protein [Herbiconiux sp. VKM Ac-2851]
MSNSEVRPWWLVVARPLGFVLALLGALGFVATVGQLGAAPGAATFLGLVGGPLIVLAGYHVGSSGATGRPRPRALRRVLVFVVLPVVLAGFLVLLLTGR